MASRMMKVLWIVMAVAGGLAVVPSGRAGEADVIGAKVTKAADGTYRFSVTVRHDDKGWDHYANRWDVVDGNGTILGTRILAHPHDNEQPFTRSLSGVSIPAGLDRVTLRAGDSVHGFGGADFTVKLP